MKPVRAHRQAGRHRGLSQGLYQDREYDNRQKYTAANQERNYSTALAHASVP